MIESALEIEERAAHWLVRRQEAKWGAADQARLEAWLRESTAHEVAYLRLEAGWGKVERLAALRRSPIPPTQPRRTGRPPRVKSRIGSHPGAWGIAAAGLLLGLVILAVYQRSPANRVYATDVGGHEIVRLADGSRIELNTGTRVQVDLTSQARTVRLLRGEAYFEVAHDRSRPFVVYAGGRRLTVLGTKFSVRLDPGANRVQLAVAEGRVQLEGLQPQSDSQPMIAIGGDRAVAEGSSMRLESRSLAAVSDDLSWRRGLLTFDQTSLTAAAEEFNRYNRTRIVIEPAAAAIQIGGRFEAKNVDAFARLLQTGFGLQVVESDGEIRVSR